MSLRLCLALALVTVVSDLAFARDIYVDNTTGDDRRGGTISTSQGNLGPCRSIAKALRIAKFGDRIVLASTDFDPHQAEERTVTAISGNENKLVQPLVYMDFDEVA